MLGRWRNKEKRTPEISGVLPTEGRPWSYRYAEADDNSERQSRVEARYVVIGGDGNEYNVTELIVGRTVTLGRGENTVTVDRAVAQLADAAGWVSDRTSPKAPRTGAYLVEYPRANAEDPTDAVLITAEANGITRYEIKEVSGQVLIVSRERHVDGDTQVKQPRGVRVTMGVRARVPTGDYPVNASDEVSYEETFFEELRSAIADYKEEYPD